MAIHETITDDGVAEIVMENPPVNALNIGDTYRLADLFDSYKRNPDVRVAIRHYPLPIHPAAGGIARACVAAEGASDSLMFPRAERLLFAPRLGQVLRPLPALPRFVVAGGFLGPGQRTRAEDEDFPDIADLVAYLMTL